MRPLTYTRAADVDAAIATASRDRTERISGRRHHRGGPDPPRRRAAEPAGRHQRAAAGRRSSDLPDGGMRIGALARMSDVAATPDVIERFPMIESGAAAGCLGTTAEHGLDRRQPLPAGPMQLLPRRDIAVQQARSGQRLRRHRRLQPRPRDSRHQRTLHRHPPVRSWPSHSSRWTPSCTHAGPTGERSIPIDDFFLLPGDTPDREHPLDHGELIVAIEVPPSSGGGGSVYLKVRDRESYEFALVSVAAAMRIDDGTIADVRLGARWRRAPSHGGPGWPSGVLIGMAPASPLSFAQAAQRELAEAVPHEFNAFKIELARRAIVRALDA